MSCGTGSRPNSNGFRCVSARLGLAGSSHGEPVYRSVRRRADRCPTTSSFTARVGGEVDFAGAEIGGSLDISGCAWIRARVPLNKGRHDGPCPASGPAEQATPALIVLRVAGRNWPACRTTTLIRPCGNIRMNNGGRAIIRPPSSSVSACTISRSPRRRAWRFRQTSGHLSRTPSPPGSFSGSSAIMGRRSLPVAGGSPPRPASVFRARPREAEIRRGGARPGRERSSTIAALARVGQFRVRSRRSARSTIFSNAAKGRHREALAHSISRRC